MPVVTLRTIGKLQENWQKQAVEMYRTRLSPFIRLDLIELAEGHEGSMKPNIEKTRQREAEQLLKGIPTGAFVIALDETGRQLTSQEFSTHIDTISLEHPSITFFIGGSWGLDETVKRQANLLLSLGKMTLPHGLARVVLLEQLYRAMMIRAGRTYQK